MDEKPLPMIPENDRKQIPNTSEMEQSAYLLLWIRLAGHTM